MSGKTVDLDDALRCSASVKERMRTVPLLAGLRPCATPAARSLLRVLPIRLTYHVRRGTLIK